MKAFRLALITLLVGLLIFTGAVIAEHGMNFITPFFSAIGEMGWQGQFNFDFAIMLLLLGFWAAWRNRFTPAGLLLGVAGVVLGAGFLTSYLLYLTWRERGDVVRILVGDRNGKAS